jgi:hypothetical protein
MSGGDELIQHSINANDESKLHHVTKPNVRLSPQVGKKR